MKDWVTQIVATVAAGVVVWYLNEYQPQPLKNVENFNFTAPVTPPSDLKADELAALVRAEEDRLKQIQNQRIAEELRVATLQRQQQLKQQQQAEEARLQEIQNQRVTEEARLVELVPQAEQQSTQQLISGRYRNNGDGTVTDVTTNLMWKRCSEGQTWTGYTCSGESTRMSWDQVMPEGQERSWPRFAGYEWILPTREQLRTLVFCSNGTSQSVAWKKSCSGKDVKVGNSHYQRPTIDVSAFPNTPSLGFWTSSLYQGKSPEWWFVGFDNGYADWHGLSRVGRVRLLKK